MLSVSKGDRGPNGEDLTGGWYDAGDHVKFNFPQSWTITTLAWGVLEYWDAYVAAGELDIVMDSIKWPLDFLIKCHVGPTKLYAQVRYSGTLHFSMLDIPTTRSHAVEHIDY